MTANAGYTRLRKSRGSDYRSCALAIFRGDSSAAAKTCTYSFTSRNQRLLIAGSAVQTTDEGDEDTDFLIQWSSPTDRWHLSCPYSSGRDARHDKIVPCDMCHVRIPWGCSLSADDFFIPFRHTGCASLLAEADLGSSSSSVRNEPFYTLNVPFMRQLLPPDVRK